MSTHPLLSPAVKVYRQVLSDGEPALLSKFRAYLPDRPGSLAEFASTIAQSGGNISFFHYDRSADCSRVAVEVQIADDRTLAALLSSLQGKKYSLEGVPAGQDDPVVTSVEGILEVKVRLHNEPGTLAAFARLLADHGANVIYMLYDEDIDAASADIAMATKEAAEIDGLLRAVNEKGYHYKVIYRGGDEKTAANIIGLKMIEKFLLRLKNLLPSSDAAEIKSLVESSRELQQDLVQFSTEAGNNLEAGDVFETVLTFASRSRARTGQNFSAIAMKPVRFLDSVELMGFRLPTSENIYVFRSKDEVAMIDAGHGIYYEDIKRLLTSHGMHPSGVKKIYVTHPDTDHVGSAGYFEREFGTIIHMHPGSADVMTNMNRAYGATGSLSNLNRYYTRLSTRFTDCLFPAHAHYFPSEEKSSFGPFKVLDVFSIGPLAFDVIESLGGHTPGLVFYLNREFGLLFTSDFLLNMNSLRPEDKEHLGIYRYLLTNPNKDSRIYREETAKLRETILKLDKELKKKKGCRATIFPGHGEYYSAQQLKET